MFGLFGNAEIQNRTTCKGNQHTFWFSFGLHTCNLSSWRLASSSAYLSYLCSSIFRELGPIQKNTYHEWAATDINVLFISFSKNHKFEHPRHAILFKDLIQNARFPFQVCNYGSVNTQASVCWNLLFKTSKPATQRQLNTKILRKQVAINTLRCVALLEYRRQQKTLTTTFNSSLSRYVLGKAKEKEAKTQHSILLNIVGDQEIDLFLLVFC